MQNNLEAVVTKNVKRKKRKVFEAWRWSFRYMIMYLKKKNNDTYLIRHFVN